MNIKFYKVVENESQAIYWIKLDYWNKSNTSLRFVEARGFCIFHKNTQKISFDPIRSDKYFFENTNQYLIIENQLINMYKQQKSFPDAFSMVVTDGSVEYFV